MKTLDEVHAFVSSVATNLDPASRYVSELLSIVNGSRDVADLVGRLDAGCRGSRHSGADVFRRMTLEQKIRANLITNETVLFRFSEGEWEILQSKLVPRFARRPGRILCAPCSHGEEAFSVAAACLQAGVGFEIDGLDIQAECVAEANRGRLTMGFPAEWLETPAIVSAQLRSHIRFGIADLLLEPGSPGAMPVRSWDLAICRNFLGYFVEPVAVAVAARLADALAPGGALFLDSFCSGKLPGIEGHLRSVGLARVGMHPVFEKPTSA